MTDRQLLETIQRMIQQHLCDHRDQFISLAVDISIEERICKWCGKVMERKALKDGS